MGKNYLIEVTPVKPDGQLATIRMSRRGVSNAGVNLDNKEWLPLLETLPIFSLNLMSSGQLQIPTISYGDLEFICSDAYGNEEWSSYDWSNALASFWYGEDGDPFSKYTQVFAGRVSGFNREEIYASVALLGSEADLQRPALFDEYEGTGGLEGGAGIKGTLKPRAHGFCKTVSPVQIDTVYLVYQVHGYGPIAGIAKVYDFAQELDPAIANVSTYNELIALDLQPGQWATCNAHGLFRLGGSTDKKLTCDVMGALYNGVYTNTVKTITQQLIREVQPTATFGTFGSFADAEWCFYAKEATSVADIVYRAVYEAGGYLIPDGAGRWQVGDFYAPVNRGQLRSDRSTLPLVIDHMEKTSTGPVWKVSVGHSRCWSVHTESEISPTIFDASGLASTEDLEDALQQLEVVKSDITLQLSRLDAMANDGVLDRAEKKYWEQEYARQSADRNKLVVDGSQFDVSAEITAYQGAATYLTNYLNGLVPAWNDGSQDTPIDRVAFKAAWESLYSAKLALTQKMTGQASEKAIWDKIIGSGKPDDGATVGAPTGTLVAGKPAEAVIDAITDANGVLIPSEQLKAEIEAAEKIAADLQATYGSTASAAASANAAAQHETNAQTAANNAAQAKADAQAAQSAANTAKDLAVSAKDGAAGFAQNSDAARAAAVVAKDAAELARGQSQTFAGNSEASRAASDAAKTASETARDQAQQFASNSSGSAQAAAGSAGTASTKATEAGQSASAAQASAVTAKATVAALLPTDFADGWTYWGSEWSSGTGTPLPEWSLVDTSYGRVARLTNPNGVMRDIANAGRIPVVAGRKLRITVKWRVLDSAGITPEIEMFRIGIPGAGGQFNNAVGHGHIPVGSSGWGDNNGFATATYDINTDDFVNVDPRSAYMRVLIRISRPGVYDVLSVRVDDVTSEQAAKSSAEAAATSQSAAAISEGIAGQSASASQQSATNASTNDYNSYQNRLAAAGHESAAWDHRVGAAGHESNAQTYRNEASQSATNAAGSASTATQQAGLSAGSANAAGQSAGAAAGSASTATSKASEASQSASAALASQVSASTTAQSLMPSTFGDSKNWSSDWGTATGDVSTDNRFNAYDHGSLGRILDIYNVPHFSPHIVPKGRISLVRDKVYRITVKWALTGYQNGTTVNAWLFAIGIKSDSATTGDYWNSINTPLQISEGQAGWGNFWATHTLEVHTNSLIDNGCQWTRPLFRLDSQGNYAVQSIEIRDITGEYHSSGSANAAAQSASSAAISKTGAEQSASAASGSATNAASSATNAEQQKEAAYQQAVNALQFRSDAETFRNQASQSATNASGSASTASEQAGLAANSAGQAAGSAGAAAGSASTASSKSDEAGQHANSASASANTASTKAGEAAGSASAAAGSASGASSSANQAGQSASAAQSAEVSATTAAQALMPATFQSLKNWTWEYRLGEHDLSADSRYTAYDHGTLGRILQVQNNPHFSPHIAPKGRISLIRDHVYRITIKWHLAGQQNGEVQQNAAIFAIGIRPDQSDWNNVNVGVSVSPGQDGWGSGSWATHTLDVHANTLLDQGVRWVRPLFRLDNQGVYNVQSVEIRDITGEYNAYSSAQAAAGSASTAAIKASEAGQSASSANSSSTSAGTSATNASNSEGAAWNHRQAAAGHEGAAWDHRVGAAGHESNAYTYRNEASQSASNAAGSASTASQQAGLASNSANSAGQSAGAAAGSASTASSKANEASQSANAASSSQVSASNAAAGAQGQFAKTFPNFVGPIGKDAYVYAGDNGNGFSWEHGPDAGWPQPYITAQAGGQGGTYNRIHFKESVPKTVGRRYRVTGWFYTNATNCQIVSLWLLNTDNNLWDGNAVGRGGDTTPPGCVNNIAINSPGFNKFGLEFTVGSDWKSLWKPVFEFQTTGGAPNQIWHMTGITIEDITSEKAAADSASAASSSYSNALYESGLALQRAQSASGSANTASIKAGEASSSAGAAAGSAATATDRAAAASSSANLAATFSTGGGNLIPETSFITSTVGWNFYSSSGAPPYEFGRDLAGDDWRPTNEHNLAIRQIDADSGRVAQWHSDQISVTGSTWYEFSAYVAAHRCESYVRVDWVDANGTGISSHFSNSNLEAAPGGRNINSWMRCWGKVQSPSNAARAHVVFVKNGTIGGYGYADSYAWFCRPMLRQTYEQASGPSPYSPGYGALTASAQQASISTNQNAIATANEQLASLKTIVQAGSPNLLKNGGFADGMKNWNGTHGGWNAHTSGGWGRVTGNGTNFEGYNYIESEHVPIFGGTHYTFAADSAYFLHSGGSGHVYLEMIWYDGAGNYITQHGGPSRAANHDFNNEGAGRAALRMIVQSPGNATHVVARLVAYKTGGGITTISWRQVKLEQGQNMTAFTNEASVTTLATAVTTMESKTSAYWQTTAVAGNGRAQLTLHADANGGGGVDIVGDVRISGDTLIGGTLSVSALNYQMFVRRKSGSGSYGGQIPVGSTILFSESMGQCSPIGSYMLELSGQYSTNAGTRSTTHNGKPLFTSHNADGGIYANLVKNGAVVSTVALPVNDTGANTGGTWRVVYTSASLMEKEVTDSSLADVYLQIVAVRGGNDTGIVDDGDTYYRQLSASYSDISVSAKAKWMFI